MTRLMVLAHLSLLTLLPRPAAAEPPVLAAAVQGAIGPVTARFMIRALERAEAENAAALVFELDTPGGLDDAMRDIVKRILASKVPVVIYVAPAGARAASAGTFLTLAAHVAAMAPGTAIGAAHPVAIGQGMPADSNLTIKAAQDAAAYIRAIAEQRGRNRAWAERAVFESVSLSDSEALTNRVIDLVATDTTALLEILDGRRVLLDDGRAVTLRTRGVPLRRLTLTWREEILKTLTNPNLAYLLFMLGLLGIYFELSNPGAIAPGVVGAIALILAFFAFQTLSISYAGLLLIVLALALFLMDIYIASGGLLTLGGIVALVIGSLLLFDRAADPALRVSLSVLVPVVAVTALFFVLGAGLSLRAMRRRPVSGAEGLVGQAGETRTPVDGGGGSVFAAGTHWDAVAETPIPAGRRVTITAVRGMTLRVKPY